MASLIVWKHRENIRRLADGTESRIGARRAVRQGRRDAPARLRRRRRGLGHGARRAPRARWATTSASGCATRLAGARDQRAAPAQRALPARGRRCPRRCVATADLAASARRRHRRVRGRALGVLPRRVYRDARAPAAARACTLVSATKGLELDTLLRMTRGGGSGGAGPPARGALGPVVRARGRAAPADRGRGRVRGPGGGRGGAARGVEPDASARTRAPTSSASSSAGALKNVIAIAAGIVDGLGYGHNTVAALVTRGLAEITRLAVALGGRADTLAGPRRPGRPRAHLHRRSVAQPPAGPGARRRPHAGRGGGGDTAGGGGRAHDPGGLRAGRARRRSTCPSGGPCGRCSTRASRRARRSTS